MDKRYLVALLVVFLFGFLTSAITTKGDYKVEDKDSPYNWIDQKEIKFASDYVVVPKIQGYEVYLANFTDTNSMDPVLDQYTNAVELIPKTTEDIHKGDIISYRSNQIKGVVIHRVSNIGTDKKGWYAETTGDNLAQKDPAKIRFEQITGVVYAILY